MYWQELRNTFKLFQSDFIKVRLTKFDFLLNRKFFLAFAETSHEVSVCLN